MAKNILRERILLGMLALSVAFAIPTFKQDIEYLAQKSVLKQEYVLYQKINNRTIKKFPSRDITLDGILSQEDNYDLNNDEIADYGELRKYEISKNGVQTLSKYPYKYAFDFDQNHIFEPCEVLDDPKMDGLNKNETLDPKCKGENTKKELKL